MPLSLRLGELLGRDVGFPSQECVDEAAANAAHGLTEGGVVLLENLRFHSAEKKGGAEFAAKLAAFGDQAMRLPPEWITGSLRFSLSRYTTSEELEDAAERIAQVFERFRR